MLARILKTSLWILFVSKSDTTFSSLTSHQLVEQMHFAAGKTSINNINKHKCIIVCNIKKRNTIKFWKREQNYSFSHMSPENLKYPNFVEMIPEGMSG